MIYLASDHAGFELKNSIKHFLKEIRQEYEDIGSVSYDELDDYPDYIIPAAKKVADNQGSLGIIIGSSGQGEAIAANKVKGVKAALYYGGPKEIVTLSKIHNNANILSLGARFIDSEEAKEAVKLWLETDFTSEDRHIRRLKKINKFENNIKNY